MSEKNNEIEFSIIVPLYDEEENARLLHQKIVETMEKMKTSYEVIYVDDASNDNTLSVCKNLKPLILISLRKNSGQTAAMSAGIKNSSGKYVVTMDGDLQNDPADIPRLYKHLIDNNLDVVSGWRKNRKDTLSKKLISRGANLLRKIFLKDSIHDSGCSLKIYRRECFETVELYGEMHRFIPALLEMLGFNIGEIEVAHHPRKYGKTKYDFSRTIKGFLDIFAVWFWRKFSGRPMHLLGGVGILCWILGTLFAFVAVWLKIVRKVDLSDTGFTILSMFLFFFGLNFLFFGILFDIAVKNHFAVTKSKPWLVKNIWKNR